MTSDIVMLDREMVALSDELDVGRFIFFYTHGDLLRKSTEGDGTVQRE